MCRGIATDGGLIIETVPSSTFGFAADVRTTACNPDARAR
jgi:hypothetical protein